MTERVHEPPSTCAPIKNSVWYAFTAAADQGVLLALDAGGDMDAVVEVFERQRSQLTPRDCRQTNRRGEATVDLDASADTDYLIGSPRWRTR